MKLKKWFSDQGWTFAWQIQDYDKAARQTAYLLVNKILFYNLLQAKRSDELDPLEIPKSLTKGQLLQSHLQAYFNMVLKIDYETIYTTDFIDETAFPDAKEVVKEIKGLIAILRQYDFSKLGFDIIGRIFERLIPSEERHNLGQYFTNADVVDLILKFTVNHEDDKILDPASGAGTFLVRAYQHKKLMNQRKKHEELLQTLWGNDIAKFPAHLATINLAINDMEYKEKIIRKALFFHKTKMAHIGKRAGIYAYFFVHGTKFLKDGGNFGFIVPNSWLDVDYGKGLQEFFLENYKITAIIESKVERWFEDADINTCIVIMQKCKDQRDRHENIVRFVYLKKPLRSFIPPARDIWEKQLERVNEIDKLKKTILAHNDFYENDELRIYPKIQEELWNVGVDAADKKYKGAKWGRYIRAPGIFFKILIKCKDILVPLREVAEVRRGFTTGANEFFYVTEEEIKKWGIEKEFRMHKDGTGKWRPNKVILSPREGKTVVLAPNTLEKIVLIIDKEKGKINRKKVLSYIKRGESKGYNRRRTCQSRKLWYSLRFRKPWPILHPMIHHDRQAVFLNTSRVQVDHNLFEIKPKKSQPLLPLLCFLLSTVSMLIKEFTGRSNLGEGALKTEGIDVEKLLVPSYYSKKSRHLILDLVKKFPDAPIESIFDDLMTKNIEEISLDKIKSHRRELDQIIMGEILGLSAEEQLEVYRAVVDVVKSRLERAKSVRGKKAAEEDIDIDSLKGAIVAHVKKEE